jgi:hypothetical protein
MVATRRNLLPFGEQPSPYWLRMDAALLSRLAMAAFDDKPVFVLSAAPIIRARNAYSLASTLKQSGASVTHRALPVGHDLSQTDASSIVADFLPGDRLAGPQSKQSRRGAGRLPTGLAVG